MTTKTESEVSQRPADAVSNGVQTTTNPGRPKASGYAEPKPDQATDRDKPNPEVAGDQASQVATALPDEDEQAPDDIEPTPPGEYKREPIKDPDPADTKLQVQQSRQRT